MTDIVLEDGDEYHPEGAVTASTQAPLGSNSSRPASPPQASYSRRGMMNRRGGHLFGGPGISMSNTSRPQSAYSRNSQTHAPSVTSQAFFRPMSSQRLQAQRGTKPGLAAAGSAAEDLPRLSSSTINRMSTESTRTATRRQDHGPHPSSRGTDFTKHDPRDRNLYNRSPIGNNTIPSAAESTRPLHKTGSRHQVGSASNGPGSFASSFFKASRSVHEPTSGQLPADTRLSTDTSSPRFHEKVGTKTPSKVIGKNHEYFSGNTVFCWGGRLQNTRDRPINIATGVMIILPAILFFVYE